MRPPQAVLFDVFGTVVDWRTPITAALGARCGPEPAGGWAAIADRWRREGYLAPIAAVAAGRAQRRPIDELLAEHLVRILGEVGRPASADVVDEMVSSWDLLTPWPDAVPGLLRLREVTTIGTLSNGTFAGQVRLARHAGLPWHCVLTADLFGSYKPDPAVYLGAAALLGLAPAEVALVAAHPPDLAAAARCGLRTVFVPRPAEWGPDAPAVEPGDVDLVAEHFTEVAALLGA